MKAAALRSTWRRAAVALLAAALIPLFASAQEKPSGKAASGRVAGTVTDAKGKALAGTAVTLSNDAPALRRTATADKKGNYRFDNVPVGRYTVTAELPEFVIAERIAEVRETRLEVDVRFFLSPASAVTIVPKTEDAPRPVIQPFGR